jgi:hypothetical protein
MTLTETLPPEVAAVRQQFEDWRATQTQRGPLPKHLWQAAVALLPRYPIALVAHACRLNPSKLKQVATGSAKQTPATTAFRTVTTETLQQAAGLTSRPVTQAAEIRFALTRRDGTQLEVTCPANTELAAALCRQLLAGSSTNRK